MWVQRLRSGGVAGLAYSRDGTRLYVAERGHLFTAWDTTTHTESQLFRLASRDHSFIRGLVLTSDGRYLLARRHPAPVIWDCVESKRLKAKTEPYYSTDAVPLPGTETRVLYRSIGNRELWLWQPASKQTNVLFAGPFETGIYVYDVSPDARTIAFATEACREVYFCDSAAPRNEPLRSTDEMDSGQVWSVRFSPDGRTLAAFSGRQLHLWNVPALTRRAEPINVHDPEGDPTFAFHPAAPIFAAVNQEKVLTLFSSETGRPIRSLDFALGRSVTCVCFSPDGLTCAVGGSNKQFAVFDVDL